MIKRMLHDTSKLDSSKLRFDGVYSTYDTARGYVSHKRFVDIYYLINAFCFFKNGLCLAPNVSYKDEAEASVLCSSNMYTEEQNKIYSAWGAYTISNDTLEVLCYRQFRKRGSG